MLTELRLTGFGVVEEAVLHLGPGLTALTGETGAGKTMIVAGLGQLLGGRGDSGIVRRGSGRALVQGRWQVPPTVVAQVAELGGDVDDGDELVTLRHVNAQGRSKAVVGGAQLPVSALSAVLDQLATIHGQSEQLRLSTPERQREILDAWAQPRALEGYRRDWAERRTSATELAALVDQAMARAREIDMLRFGVEEIAAAAPEPNEDRLLAAEATRLMDADDLRQLATTAQTALSGDDDDFDVPSAVGLLGEARKAIAALAERDDLAGELSTRVQEAQYLLDDVAVSVASYAADLVADPARLEAVGQRRAQLAGLARKYGPGLDDVLAWAQQASESLLRLEGSDDRIEQLRARVAELDERLSRAADAISGDRRVASEELSALVETELRALAMPHASLTFELTPTEQGPHGADRIELMFTANPGSAPAPLGKVASGGELSRVRLALEVVLAGGSAEHTFVFDEVDAGVGGAVGLEIGRRLQRLASTSQVIVVTHLAQVAAFADAHFVVAKASDGQVTTSDVRRLDDAERPSELARMMGGSGESVAGLDHAMELWASARR
ncbi:MAG: DNA repair protein RecN [Propionibacteriaceae bacterium]|nr:DNA repair protein RecN [Propionibacteriaceae bacterium]